MFNQGSCFPLKVWHQERPCPLAWRGIRCLLCPGSADCLGVNCSSCHRLMATLSLFLHLLMLIKSNCICFARQYLFFSFLLHFVWQSVCLFKGPNFVPLCNICTIFCIHPSVDGYLGCFHVLAIVDSAAVTIGVYVSF